MALALCADGGAADERGLPPGALPRAPALASRLWNAALADSAPRRSAHRQDDGSPRFVNRLVLEASPYLRQHAFNPVDWYAWGDEAFERARREDRPIFLSIGYSTCHWCHVMERESFDDVEVARALNEGFVAIKVDREERPEVDEVYMSAVQRLTGSGGWPLSVLVLPDGRPFVGTTYLPKTDFLRLLAQVRSSWTSDRGRLTAQAEKLAAALARDDRVSGDAAKVDDDTVSDAVARILSLHDRQRGGFGSAPKFPHAPLLTLLLQQTQRRDDDQALAAVETTLDAMARGGIYDQVGGGFHRYATDADWRLPHFEKMLTDQAQLARIYADAARLTGRKDFERVARQTLEAVLRDFLVEGGAFAAAIDADSEEREGAFYLWTPEQLRQVLGPADGAWAARLFAVEGPGELEGANVLHVSGAWPAAGASEEAHFRQRLDDVRLRLWRARETRVHPLRDDKVVTAWNAQMVASLAHCAEVLGDDAYLAAARRAAEFLWTGHRRPDGGLWRASLAGKATVAGTLDDAADLAAAFLALADVTAEPVWLERAQELARDLVVRFGDRQAGGFFQGEDGPTRRLPRRPKPVADGAMPSGNATALAVLARLAARTGDPSWRQLADGTIGAFAGHLRRSPTSSAAFLAALDELRHGGVGPRAFAAGGVARAEARQVEGPDGAASVELALTLAEGWHVNSATPLQEELIASRLEAAGEGWTLGPVAYPEGERIRLGFLDEPVSVWRGRVVLRAPLLNVATRRASVPVVHLRLRIQACDDHRCLAPEVMELELAALSRRAQSRAAP